MEQETKKSRPILFSTDMVQAILANKKKQTRRVIKPPFEFAANGYLFKPIKNERFCPYPCPYGSVGDRLWVRETFYDRADYSIIGKYQSPRYIYFADVKKSGWIKHPSIFMPREAARIFLEIKKIRVERLQEITEEDAIAEGIQKHEGRYALNFRQPDAKSYLDGYTFKSADAFKQLWNSINAKKHPWNSNPWVWVIEFEKLKECNP